jgi:hypothetical protein
MNYEFGYSLNAVQTIGSPYTLTSNKAPSLSSPCLPTGTSTSIQKIITNYTKLFTDTVALNQLSSPDIVSLITRALFVVASGLMSGPHTSKSASLDSHNQFRTLTQLYTYKPVT